MSLRSEVVRLQRIEAAAQHAIGRLDMIAETAARPHIVREAQALKRDLCEAIGGGAADLESTP